MHGSGCLRPLLISFGAVSAFLAALAVINRDVVRVIWDNARSMGEGADWVERLKSPDDLFTAIRAGDLRGSVAVLEGDGSEVLTLHADSLRPVFGVTRLDVLEQVVHFQHCGRLDLNDDVPASQLEELSLVVTGTEDPAHGRSPTDSLTVGEVVRRMMTERDQAAQDWLVLSLTADSLRDDTCGPPTGCLPAPFLAVLLSTQEDPMDGGHAGRVWTSSTGEALIDRFRSDPDWRRSRKAALRSSGSRLGIREQEKLASERFYRGSARHYAGLMLGRLDQPGSGMWPDPASVREGGIVSAGGAFPGVISLAAGQMPVEGHPGKSAVLLLESVPTAVFYHLVRTGMDRALLLELLANPRRLAELPK